MGKPHVVITGMMGVGKSTTARALAGALGWPVRDSDSDIQRLFEMTGAELADSFGVDELHRAEAAVLLGALAADQPTVISAAGWVVEDDRCRDAMGIRSTVVVLDATMDVIVARSATGAHRRPMTRAEVLDATSVRSPLFGEIADLKLSADRRTEDLVEAIVAEIL